MEFKDKVSYLRKKNDLTLKELSKLTNISAPTLSRYESGEIKNVRRDKISKLAAALNCSPAYLMGWVDDDSPNELTEGHDVPTVNLIVTEGKTDAEFIQSLSRFVRGKEETYLSFAKAIDDLELDSKDVSALIDIAKRMKGID